MNRFPSFVTAAKLYKSSRIIADSALYCRNKTLQMRYSLTDVPWETVDDIVQVINEASLLSCRAQTDKGQ